MSRNVTARFAVLVLVLAAGCGDDGAAPDASGPATPSTDVPSTASPPPAVVLLDIDAGSDELPDARSASVVVDGGVVEVNGYIDRRDAVAGVLADATAVARLVDGPATDVACTEQYGGPDVARVVGTIDGRPVDTTFHRADGCGIADWELVQPILPTPIWSTGPDAAIGDAANPVISAVGSRFTIRLDANATTGYAWDIALPTGLAVAEERYEGPDDGDVVGAGGVQVFVIEAVDVGSGVIELAYRQPFDEAGQPAETRSIHVEVDAAS